MDLTYLQNNLKQRQEGGREGERNREGKKGERKVRKDREGGTGEG